MLYSKVKFWEIWWCKNSLSELNSYLFILWYVKVCSVELANELPKSLHTSFPLLRIKSWEGDWWKRGSLLKIQILLEKSDSVCICVIIQCYVYQYCCIFLNRKWNLLQGRKLLTVKWGKTNMTDLIHTKKTLEKNLEFVSDPFALLEL